MDPAIYGHTLLALLQTLGILLDQNLAAEFLAIGIDLNEPLKATYPTDVWGKAVAIAARRFRPYEPSEEGEYQLGRRFVYAFGKTDAGKGLPWALHTAGPRRTLEQLNSLLQLTNSFTATRVLEQAPTDYQVWIGNVTRPYFVRGLCASAVEAAGAVDARVEILQQTAEGVMYRARWYDVVQDLRIRLVRV